MSIPSPLLDRLAQLLVLYEHLRIATFAVTSSAEESIEPETPDAQERVRRSMQCFAAALLEFDRGLTELWRTDEYKSAAMNYSNSAEMEDLTTAVSNALRHFQERRAVLMGLGKSGEEYGDADTVFRPGGGIVQPSDTGQSASPAVAINCPPVAPSAEQIKDALCIVREGYSQATQAIHGLVTAFVRDRF